MSGERTVHGLPVSQYARVRAQLEAINELAQERVYTPRTAAEPPGPDRVDQFLAELDARLHRGQE